MKTSIFISRELSDEHSFLQQLSWADYEVIGESLVEFRAVPFATLPEVDWIFFYSKRAVEFFIQNINERGLNIQARLAALGKGTAKALEARMYQADFVGAGTPEHTAAYFGLLALGQKVLFPRAANSRESIQKLLENKIIPIDLIVYNNQPRQDFTLPLCDWLVFTSPLNAQAYFAKYPLKPGQQVAAIGNTTAAALQQLGILNVHIAEEPSEIALAELIRTATRP